MIVTNSDVINHHYDLVISLVNSDRKRCLDILERDGVVCVKKRGQLWEVIG